MTQKPASSHNIYDRVEHAAQRVGLIVMGALHPRQVQAKQLDGGTLILFLTSDIFSYKSLILLCLGCQKALHGLFSPAIVSEC
ncbi:hypothetical protein [Ruegeria sp.]|uniref:hypothetical protein n=1 Tax=Ruegeria sp. TaxID=1879320 RepID=UPI003B002D02